ncbi:MAG: formate dehydrogenase accessory sulfurtransferase FdhD [Pseudomonadota bacterium]
MTRQRPYSFTEVFSSGAADAARTREVAVEAPIALEFNGIGFAVMMATPADLEDFVTGFAIAERLIPPNGALHDVAVFEADNGIVLRARVPQDAAQTVLARARRRVTESSCGLCGMENLEEIARPLPPVSRPLSLSPEAIFAAHQGLSDWQPLSSATGAVHAAAICAPAGTILLAREDVGRHNALDKAIGARTRSGLEGDHFALVTARCSYERVEKAAIAGLGALVTISAPTSLALDRAKAANLPLYVLTRTDSTLRLL